MDGYLQRAPVVKTTPSGAATLTLGDIVVSQGSDLSILSGAARRLRARSSSLRERTRPPCRQARSLLIAPPEGPGFRATGQRGGPEGCQADRPAAHRGAGRQATGGGQARASIRLAETAAGSGPIVVVVAPETFDRMKTAGGSMAFSPGETKIENGVTTNAVGWLQGTDPDRRGADGVGPSGPYRRLADGAIMHGANDDASGTVAVIELASALSAAGPHERSIMFVAYGSEEAGLLGSRYFVAHPPIPLEEIAANLEIEMIGDQDPQLPAGVMMMTGFDRSNFGAALKDRGALVGPDPYPEQNFFERSDNYALAQRGIVAHTVSGWATIPTYHTADDTIENLDIPFMTNAIQSLVAPLAAMADGDFTPEWSEGGRPEAR